MGLYKIPGGELIESARMAEPSPDRVDSAGAGNPSASAGITFENSASRMSPAPRSLTTDDSAVGRVQVIETTGRAAMRTSGPRAVVGLLLVAAAPWIASSPARPWYELASVVPYVGSFLADWWAPWAAGAGLLVVVGLFLKSGLLRYLITTLMVGVTAYCADMLTGETVPLPWLLFGAVVLGYLMHLGGGPRKASITGTFGWSLIAFCCVGGAQGWFDWSSSAEKLGGQLGRLLEDRNKECAWAVILLLTAVGVSCSRTKSIHFLNAVLLGVLAYYCFQDAYVRMVDFSALGEHVAPLPDPGLKNIQPWQWVLVGELVLLGAVLLHLAMGVGALTVGFGVLWLVAAYQVDRGMGRDALFAFSQAAQANLPQSASSPPGGPMGGFSLLPTDSAGASPPVVLTAVERIEYLRKAQARVATIFGWIYLTAILGGMIAVSGLRLLLRDARLQAWASYALWFGFGLGAGWLWTQWPAAETWDARLTAWVLPGTHVYALFMAFLGTMAVLGGWALRGGSRSERWTHVAVVGIFLGTALSLIAIQVLIQHGGFSPLPVWSYAVLAAGQSSMMWVLLMHHNLRFRSVMRVASADK